MDVTFNSCNEKGTDIPTIGIFCNLSAKECKMSKVCNIAIKFFTRVRALNP